MTAPPLAARAGPPEVGVALRSDRDREGETPHLDRRHRQASRRMDKPHPYFAAREGFFPPRRYRLVWKVTRQSTVTSWGAARVSAACAGQVDTGVRPGTGEADDDRVAGGAARAVFGDPDREACRVRLDHLALPDDQPDVPW